MVNNHSHVQETLKSLDPERYLSCLYLPEKTRHIAMILYAFDVEISRIPDLVSEPMPGEIRIQWWRDLIKSNGNAGSGPLAEELLKIISEKDLARDVFDNYLEAKIFDLYQDPMPDIGSYEGYLGETVSSFLHMLSVSAGYERNSNLADACGHAGVAIGISKHLSLCALSRRRGQVYFPLSILTQHGLTRETWLAGNVTDAHKAFVLEMVQLAKGHLAKARVAIFELPKENRSVFLTLIFADSILSKITQKPTECLNNPIILSPLKRQWLAFRGINKL